MRGCLLSRTFVRVIRVRLSRGRYSFPFVFPLLSRVNGIRLELTAVEDRRVLQGFSEQLARLAWLGTDGKCVIDKHTRLCFATPLQS